ncbi:hypothetical protein VTI74DRAFT_5583 [Chaetomium olivicolor]
MAAEVERENFLRSTSTRPQNGASSDSSTAHASSRGPQLREPGQAATSGHRQQRKELAAAAAEPLPGQSPLHLPWALPEAISPQRPPANLSCPSLEILDHVFPLRLCKVPRRASLSNLSPLAVGAYPLPSPRLTDTAAPKDGNEGSELHRRARAQSNWGRW